MSRGMLRGLIAGSCLCLLLVSVLYGRSLFIRHAAVSAAAAHTAAIAPPAAAAVKTADAVSSVQGAVQQAQPEKAPRLSPKAPIVVAALRAESGERMEKEPAKEAQPYHAASLVSRQIIEAASVSAALGRKRHALAVNSGHSDNPDEREEEEGEMKKEPRPFHPDSDEERRKFEDMDEDASHGEWRDIGPNNFGGKTYSVAVDPHDPNSVYAAYEVGGLWGTHDGGQSWIPMFNGFQDIAFSSVRTHPHVRGLVAAGLIAYGGGYFRSFNKDAGIALSKDGGETWKLIGPTIDKTASVWEIGFGDDEGRIIYAPTEKGLYKTTDQGGSWTKILAYPSAGFTPNFFDDRPSFAVDPADPNVLLLASATIGVMRSTDAGKSWKEVDTWVEPTVQRNATILTWSKANPNYVYAEAYTAGNAQTLTMYTSTDAGQTWTAGAATSEFQQGTYDMAIAADPFSAEHVIIHNTSLQYSTDALSTLQDGTAPGPDCLAVTFDPENQGVIYDGGDDGVFKSTDGGNTWARFDTGVLTNKSIGGSLYAVGTDGKIYTNPADYAGQAYIPGVGWERRGDGYEYNRYYVNPHDPNQLYLMGGNGFFRSPNAKTAQASIDPAPSEPSPYNYLAVDFDPVDSNTLYVGKNELFKSTDRGNSWTQIGGFDSKGVYLVKVAPSNVKHIYVVAGGYLWSTTDGGASWASGAATPGGVGMMAVSPVDENTVYIAAGTGIYKSTDSGVTLPQLPGFPAVSTAWVMTDPQRPRRVYAALSNSGVLVSNDDGDSWKKLGHLLPLVQVDWMSEMGGNLYAGTGASVWEMNLDGEAPCRQVTVNPPSLTVPSSAGSYSIDVSIPANCSWNTRSSVPWATVQTFGEHRGDANPQVTFADNTGTGSTTRTGTLRIAGQSIPVTQLGGSDPVQDGHTVALSNSRGCVTIGSSSANLGMATCASGNQNQEFTLERVSGMQYRFINLTYGMQCFNVYNDAIQIGSTVAEYSCTGTPGSNETFTLQPQTNGTWMLIGIDSQLCLSIGSSGGVLNTCNSGDASEVFTIAQVPPGFNLTASPDGLALVQGQASGSSTVTVNGVNFSGNVNLAVSGLPQGVTASFSPNPATGTSTLTLKASSTAALGATNITITGTSGSIASSTSFGLTVNSVASTAIQFVQANANDTTTSVASASSVSAAYTAAQIQGDLNIVVVGWEDATATVSSVTDSSGNVYKLAVGPTQSAAMPGTQAIYYASKVKAASAGVNTVTVTFNTAAAYPDVRIAEYTGVSTLDAVATANGSSSTMNSGVATTTSAPELLFGANNMENWTTSPGAGYKQRLQSNWGNIIEDAVISVPGAYSASAVESPASGWIMQLVTFK